MAISTVVEVVARSYFGMCLSRVYSSIYMCTPAHKYHPITVSYRRRTQGHRQVYNATRQGCLLAVHCCTYRFNGCAAQVHDPPSLGCIVCDAEQLTECQTGYRITRGKQGTAPPTSKHSKRSEPIFPLHSENVGCRSVRQDLCIDTSIGVSKHTTVEAHSLAICKR